MRLGFHYHVPAIQRHNEIWMPGYFGLFIDSIAEQCDSVVCFLNSPVEWEIEQMDYRVRSSNVRLMNLGPHITIPLRTLRMLPYLPALQKWQKALDVLLIRAPTPLLPIFRQVWHKPVSLLLVSDELSGIDNLPQPPWRKKLIRLWATWNDAQLKRLSQRSLVFVNSRLLYDQYKPYIPQLYETQTTTLSTDDFYFRKDTCAAPPYHLLYAGRITRIKGLFEMVKAVANLVTDGLDVVLDLVGMIDRSDPILDNLRGLAQSLGIEERVCYHGYKTAGPELLAYYRKADLYIIGSQSSNEGFPRTIWEAMASSTPVIATSVGSIPFFAGKAALLIPPKDVDALTEGIKHLLTNPETRQAMIQIGMLLAQQNTLEKRAKELVTQIENWQKTGGSA